MPRAERWLGALWVSLAVASATPPELIRVYPLGGQAGTTVTLEILGERLANSTGVEFDCRDLVWSRTIHAGPGKLMGEVAIAKGVAPGAHMLHVLTLEGPSNSGIFNVGTFPSQLEVEPNDELSKAQLVSSFPVEIQGRLDGAPDIDIFAFTVRKGERRVFDLRSIENGSAVEARMILLDAAGKRVAFNDDRDDYNENPRLEYVFPASGKYYVKLDQYRGPRGFNFGKLCAYTLRVSASPVIESVQPLAVRRGSSAVLRISGSGLEHVEGAHLSQLRQAEYARMTYPYTMPIQFRPDPPVGSEVPRISGRIQHRQREALEAAFAIPADAAPGLWRLWLAGRNSLSEAITIDVEEGPVLDETAARSGLSGPLVINGALSRPGESDVYRLSGIAGQPIHVWTMAEQLGVPLLDSVLTLRDINGKKLAENDDVVAGQGTLMGNPDSSIYFTPKQDGPLLLEVRDRTRRGGPGYQYCLKLDHGVPGFQLFTTPENFTVAQGSAAEIKVHLIREAGFEGEVEVWFEGLPPGVEAPRGRFRADQLFEPNADGADMIIPEIGFQIHAPQSLPAGTYPIRARGAAVRHGSNAGPAPVEAHATFMQGPLLDLWNFVRRPLPAICMTVTPPFSGTLITEAHRLSLAPGNSATIELKAEQIPETAPIRLLDLPEGVKFRVVGRQGSQVTLLLEAGAEVPPGKHEVSAEALLGGRRVVSSSFELSIPSAASR